MKRCSGQLACPRNGNAGAAEAALRGCQAEKAREGIWNAEQADRYLARRSCAGIARQPLSPGEPIMRARCT
jgi:hypothetical protein